MATFKAKLWGEEILNIDVDSSADADALERYSRTIQGHYFLFGALLGAITTLLPILGLMVLT